MRDNCGFLRFILEVKRIKYMPPVKHPIVNYNTPFISIQQLLGNLPTVVMVYLQSNMLSILRRASLVENSLSYAVLGYSCQEG